MRTAYAILYDALCASRRGRLDHTTALVAINAGINEALEVAAGLADEMANNDAKGHDFRTSHTRGRMDGARAIAAAIRALKKGTNALR